MLQREHYRGLDFLISPAFVSLWPTASGSADLFLWYRTFNDGVLNLTSILWRCSDLQVLELHTEVGQQFELYKFQGWKKHHITKCNQNKVSKWIFRKQMKHAGRLFLCSSSSHTIITLLQFSQTLISTTILKVKDAFRENAAEQKPDLVLRLWHFKSKLGTCRPRGPVSCRF